MRSWGAAAIAVLVALAAAAPPAHAASPFAGLFKRSRAGPPAAPAASGSGWTYEGKTFATSWDEYQAMLAAAKGGTKMTWDRLPDWTGLWTHDNGFTIDPLQTGPRATAELTPEYQRMYDEKLARVARGIEWDPLSECLPAGYPRWLVEPFLREFVLRPEEAWLITEQMSEVRRIYADGRGHVPEDEAYPTWHGDSIGFWDGDTLVVHTNNLKAGTYQRLQPEHSDQVTTVERWRKIGPDLIELWLTIYDPVALKRPWRVRHTYSRVKTPNLRINYWSCSENNNVVKTEDGSSTFVLPGEAGYKDAATIGTRPTGGAQ